MAKNFVNSEIIANFVPFKPSEGVFGQCQRGHIYGKAYTFLLYWYRLLRFFRTYGEFTNL